MLDSTVAEPREALIRASDGTQLRTQVWTPDGTARANFLLVHGLSEHLGRYAHIGAELEAAGYCVTGVELRGHGRSEGRRGHVKTWNDYVDDLRSAAASIDGPFVLLAHSMGGLVAMEYLAAGGSAEAVILSSPLFDVGFEPPSWKASLASLLSYVAPALPLGNEIDPKWLCTVPEVVEDYENDPLVFRTVTPRWYTEMVAACARVPNSARRCRLPLYLNLGSEDCVVSNRSAREAFTHWAGPKKLREWEGYFHEPLHEPRWRDVLSEMLRWLEETVGREDDAGDL